MAEERIVIAGFGGQGVMAAGQILTYSGMVEGKQVSWVPSFGPEMRGGTANCNVVISDEEIGAPTVTVADVAMVFNEASFDKFENAVKPGGALYINASMTDKKTDRDDIDVYYVRANEIATKLGNERTVNMIMLGAYLETRGDFKMESIEEAFTQVFGEHRAHLWEINEKAIEAGKEEVR